MPIEQLLDKICSEYKNKGSYCFLKEIASHNEIGRLKLRELRCYETDTCPIKYIIIRKGLSKRTIKELRCIEKYKYIKSEEAGRDVGWDGAIMSWRDEGLAKTFDEVYDEKLNRDELWKRIFDYSS